MTALPASTRAKMLAVAALVQEILENDDLAREQDALAPVASADAELCEHPTDKRVPAPVMGNSARFICTSCRSVVEE